MLNFLKYVALRAKTKLAFSQKPGKIFDSFFGYESLTIWSEKCSYLNYYILIEFIFIP
jgi:hypothetical protein